jgi:hypothetical protein
VCLDDVTTGEIVLMNNTISGNSESGVYFKNSEISPAKLWITNNIISENTNYGIQEADGWSDPQVSYNCLYNNTGGNYLDEGETPYSDPDDDVAECSGTIVADPSFANTDLNLEKPYSLKPDSPCIDAGDPNSDYSLEPEPNGGRINLGAYGGTVNAQVSPLSISLDKTTWRFSINLNETRLMEFADRIKVQNSGGDPITLSLKITDEGSVIKSGTNPGDHTYVLQAIFLKRDTDEDLPGDGDFDSEDVVTTTSEKATSTKFGTTSLSGQNGVSIQAGDYTHLFLKFQAPTHSTITGSFGEKTVTITIGASYQ